MRALGLILGAPIFSILKVRGLFVQSLKENEF